MLRTGGRGKKSLQAARARNKKQEARNKKPGSNKKNKKTKKTKKKKKIRPSLRVGSESDVWHSGLAWSYFPVGSESDVRQWHRGFGSAVGTGMPWCFPVSEAAAKAGSCRLQRLVF